MRYPLPPCLSALQGSEHIILSNKEMHREQPRGNKKAKRDPIELDNSSLWLPAQPWHDGRIKGSGGNGRKNYYSPKVRKIREQRWTPFNIYSFQKGRVTAWRKTQYLSPFEF